MVIRKRILSLFCSLMMLISLPVLAAASATPRASDYFGYTDVYATPLAGGKILIETEVEATHTMLEVGAKKIYIYEEQSDGSFEIVHTFSKETTAGMIATNTPFCDTAVIYQGTIGKTYYAKCALYARDSSGSETLYFNTFDVVAQRNPG